MAVITVTSRTAWLGANPPGAWLQLLTENNTIIASMAVDDLSSREYVFPCVVGEVAMVRIISGPVIITERILARTVGIGDSVTLEIRLADG